MKVILRKEHEKLGNIGDVVEVKDGYARNYLFPKKLAYPATDGAMHALEEEKKQAEQRLNKERKGSEKLAGELEKVSITLQMKVGEDEKLFGSVTSQMIADALKEKGFDLDKRVIELEEPIKALGIYNVTIKLPQNLIGKVKVWVVRE
ncbi:MAG: 50S ribosomal protein L9 [Ignavibacteriae bacterium]|nr:50S ribosomal protein L9 [Ignavibacteriota bacterium]